MSCFSSFSKSCTGKLLVLQQVPHWLRFLQMHFCHFEKQWLSEYNPKILSKIFQRYADYIFVMFLCESHFNDFVNYMNTTKHPNLKFTSELEKIYSFSFLDVKITPSNNQLVTSVFRKATFSGDFKFFAYHIQVWLIVHFTSSFHFCFFFISNIS